MNNRKLGHHWLLVVPAAPETESRWPSCHSQTVEPTTGCGGFVHHGPVLHVLPWKIAQQSLTFTKG